MAAGTQDFIGDPRNDHVLISVNGVLPSRRLPDWLAAVTVVKSPGDPGGGRS